MKIINLKQNTPEWEEFRRSKIGASDCPIICGKSSYKTSFDLWEEKIKGKKSYESHAMKYGKEMEPLAVAHYKYRFMLNGEPLVVQHENIDYMLASIDCLFDDHILEVKCPQKRY